MTEKQKEYKGDSFNGKTPDFDSGNGGSTPSSPAKFKEFVDAFFFVMQEGGLELPVKMQVASAYFVMMGIEIGMKEKDISDSVRSTYRRLKA